MLMLMYLSLMMNFGTIELPVNVEFTYVLLGELGIEVGALYSYIVVEMYSSYQRSRQWQRVKRSRRS
jgi:hypothetical protein